MNVKQYIPLAFKRRLKRIFGSSKNYLDFLPAANAENPLGNLQRDESIFLYGLLKVLRPKVVVEFGFLNGFSSSVILSALDKTSRLYSYDNSDYAKNSALSFTRKHRNFFFQSKRQEDFDPKDVGGSKLDFVLVDASHDLQVNIITFEKIKDSLTDDSLIMVHDTGLWHRKFMKEEHFACLNTTAHKWLDADRVAHQINDLQFINWIIQYHQDFAMLNFGSSNILRHGFTLIGKNKILEV